MLDEISPFVLQLYFHLFNGKLAVKMVSFQHKGQIQLTVNKQGRGGNIQVVREQNVSKHSFKCLPISNKTGLDCLKQTHSNADLTVVGMI